MAKDRFFLFGTAVLALTGAPAIAQAPVPVDAASYARTADRYRIIDGTRLRIRDEGDAKAPPIILVHGFSFSLESWDGWAADLARDHRVIRYDLAGHGLSAPDARSRYGTLDRVRELLGVMNALHLHKAAIAGNSFGGLVAWNFAALYPDRVDRLILVDSAAFSINGVTERPVAVPPIMRAYLQAPSAAAVAGSAGAIFAHPEALAPERLALMRAMIARNGPALIAHLEQFTLPDPRAALGRIKAPTLILWGRADRVVPVAQAGDLAAAIRGSRLIIYDDVGHAPQEEASARSIADVRTFLNNK